MSEESIGNLHFSNKSTRIVDEAEKEASEVLHSLLSVERIEKPDNFQNNLHQVVVLSNNGEDIPVHWHNGSLQHHSNMFTLDNNNVDYTQGSVIWDNGLTLDVESTTQETEHMVVEDSTGQTFLHQETKSSNNNKSNVRKAKHKWQKKTIKSTEKVPEASETEEVEGDDVNGVEGVRQRFRMGCECSDVSCFQGLNPDSVYKHRLNIAELTKDEHDMYLMGVTMACMSDPDVTVKQRERRRLRAQYVYQGRRVCLSAFLYLENCTLYQLKRIRKHVMTHGVTPRVHGNHGKKPHNVFSLETYRRATDFLKGYIDQHNTNTGNCKNTVIFPPEISRKTVHNVYQQYMKKTAPPEEKTMGYSTFRHFMKEQFPHVKFCKVELGTQNSANSSHQLSKQQNLTCPNNTNRATNTEEPHTVVVQSQAPSAPVQGVTTIPVLIQEPAKQQTTYIVTPMSQVVQAPYQTITVTPITNYAFATL